MCIRDSRDTATLGNHIVVQGGTFYNDAVLRAFELIVGKNVIRPNIAGLMGAYGVALLAKEQFETNNDKEYTSTILKNNELDRKKLADIVFFNRAEKEKLDGLTFEYVVEEIKKELEVDEVNDDSLGADFYEIDKLSKDELSSIAILELEKLGYKLK